MREVVEREGVDLFVYDEEFESLTAGLEFRHGRYRAWVDTRADADDTLGGADRLRRLRPGRPSRRGRRAW